MERRTRAVGHWLVPAVVAGLLLLSSCGLASYALPNPTVPAAPAADAVVHPRWSGCGATGAFTTDEGGGAVRPPGGAVPAGFVAVAALRCSQGERTTAAGDTVQVNLEGRADDIDALLTYLARPSETSTHPDRLVCPAVGWVPPWLFLQDASGHWLTPALPTGACGMPLDDATDTGPAYANLTFFDRVVGRG